MTKRLTNQEMLHAIEDIEAFTYTLPRDLQERLELVYAALSSPCACGGRKPLLKANAYMMSGLGEWDALQSWLDGVWGNDGGEIPVCRKQNECFDMPVTILALPAEEGT